MAFVRHLRRVELEAKGAHSEASASYSFVTDENGDKLLQIDTYGSPTRKRLGVKSQSIRFSKGAIDELREILTALGG